MHILFIIIDNFKCLFCKNKKCRARYYPNRKNIIDLDDTTFVFECKKEQNNEIKKSFNEELS